eukprot:g14093.t1
MLMSNHHDASECQKGQELGYRVAPETTVQVCEGSAALGCTRIRSSKCKGYLARPRPCEPIRKGKKELPAHFVRFEGISGKLK